MKTLHKPHHDPARPPLAALPETKAAQRTKAIRKATKAKRAKPKEATCDSCGVPYVEHLGLIGTCAKLQKAINLAHIQLSKGKRIDDWMILSQIMGMAEHALKGKK